MKAEQYNNNIKIPLISNRSVPEACLQQKSSLERLMDRVAGHRFINLIASYLIFPITDRLIKRWFASNNSPYLQEIKECESKVNLPGLATRNGCSIIYCCTTSATQVSESPTLIRVMDLSYDGLGEHIMISNHQTKNGSYQSFTWPGTSGCVHGNAPNRFACAYNLGPFRKTILPLGLSELLGDGNIQHAIDCVTHIYNTYNNKYINEEYAANKENIVYAPDHLMRHVFENAKNYEEAKEMLQSKTICIPTIFTIVGTEKNEACIIYRMEHQHVTVEMKDNPNVAAANHFPDEVWQTFLLTEQTPTEQKPRTECSHVREQEMIAKKDGVKPEDDWLQKLGNKIINPLTRVVFIANPQTGRTTIQGYEKDPQKPDSGMAVTEKTTIQSNQQSTVLHEVSVTPAQDSKHEMQVA